MAQVMELLLHELMKGEGTAVLQAALYERSEKRRDEGNGFKLKTVRTRVGPPHLRVPQTRSVESYNSALGRGEQSNRVLKPVSQSSECIWPIWADRFGDATPDWAT